MVPRTSGAAGRCWLLPGTANWARIDPGHDGSLYFGWRTEGGAGRSQARVSPIRTGLQARGHPGAKKGGSQCQDSGSRNAFGPVGASALVPAAGTASAGGNGAREEIAPQVLLKAQQDKGLWECAPAVLNCGVLRWDRRGGIFSTPRSKGMGLQGVENTLTKEWKARSAIPHPFNQLKLVHKALGHSIGIGQGESSKHRLFVSLDPFGKALHLSNTTLGHLLLPIL